jgi:hypothetical protein
VRQGLDAGRAMVMVDPGDRPCKPSLTVSNVIYSVRRKLTLPASLGYPCPPAGQDIAAGLA